MNEIVNDAQQYFLNASPFILCGIAAIAICYLCRVAPFIPNKFIPLVCIMIPAILFPIMSKIPPEDHQQINYPSIKYVIIGLVIGVVSWMVHEIIIKKLEDKLGKFAGNTETQQKQETKKNEETTNNPPASGV